MLLLGYMGCVGNNFRTAPIAHVYLCDAESLQINDGYV